MSETHLSRDAKERLEAELHDLTTRGRTEIAQAIERARELGDLSENADYHAAKDAQGAMESRIRRLQSLLENAVVVDETSLTDEVKVGSVVGIRYDGDDDVEKYLIGSIEERRADVTVVSPGSPLGQALLGCKPGDIVEYEAPSGKLRVTVVEVGG